MFILCESVAACEKTKPVYCQKCHRGKIGFIPDWSETDISRRGRPPSKQHSVELKCYICGTKWSLTIE